MGVGFYLRMTEDAYLFIISPHFLYALRLRVFQCSPRATQQQTTI